MPRIACALLALGCATVSIAHASPRHCSLEQIESSLPDAAGAFSALSAQKRLETVEALAPGSYRGFYITYAQDLKIAQDASLRHPADLIFDPLSDKVGGMSNRGVYRYVTPSGESRMIKVLLSDADPTDDDEILKELRGSYLGELEGAPKTRGFGTVHFSFNGIARTAHYIEMDEAFPGEPKLTIKNSYLKIDPHKMPEEEATFRRMVLQKGPDGIAVTERMAMKLISAFEKGTNPDDPDFFISERGEVQWIDTSLWKRASADWTDEAKLAAGEITRVLPLGCDARKQFILAVAEHVRKSPVFSKERKLEFLKKLLRQPDLAEIGIDRATAEAEISAVQ